MNETPTPKPTGVARPTQARDFLDELANIARSHGREAIVTEEASEWRDGVVIAHLSIPAPHWYDHHITGFAVRGSNGWWRFKGVGIIGKVAGKDVKASTYSSARILVDVYSR